MNSTQKKERGTFDDLSTHKPTKAILSIIGQHVLHVRPHNPSSKVVGVVEKMGHEQLAPTSVENCRDIIWLDPDRPVRDTTYLAISDDLEYLTIGKEPEEEWWSITKVTYHDMYGVREYLVSYGTEQEIIEKAFIFSRAESS